MRLTRFADAERYEAKAHFDMAGLRLQGAAGDPASISLSYFLPGGGAERSASASDKYYVVLDGEITVVTDAGEETLSRLDSCRLVGGQARSIVNRGKTVATMLVVILDAKSAT